MNGVEESEIAPLTEIDDVELLNVELVGVELFELAGDRESDTDIVDAGEGDTQLEISTVI